MDKKLKISISLNVTIIFLVTFSYINMVTGFNLVADPSTLSDKGLAALRYFTVDSNLLCGITSLIMLIYEVRLAKGKIFEIPKFVKYLTHMGVTGVMLTLLVTVFYLSPMYGSKFYTLFLGSNFFFHLVIPVLACVEFLVCEVRQELKFKASFIGIIPMLIYAVFYVAQALIHITDGVVSIEYDWYSFCQLGIKFIPIVLIVMIGITYLISFVLYKLNKKVVKKYAGK